MARTRQDGKREKILEAAVRVFARKGYFNSRVSDVARKAGVADGTIYLYFRNKEDLLVSLFDDVMGRHIAQAREELRDLKGPSAKLRRIAEHHLKVFGGNRDLAIVFQVELRQSTKFMERFTASWLQDYFAQVGAVIEEGQKDGTFRTGVPKKLVTKAFFGALDEMVTSWILSGKDYDLPQLAQPIADLFLNGLAAPRKASSRAALRVVASSGGK
jgi:TetR/AcrR family transcriptional regulator, fatty acid metabolism regulator protein